MPKKLRIEYNKSRCIGTGSCAAIDSENFEFLGQKATLLNSKQVDKDIYTIEAEYGDTAAKSLIDAGIACPVNAIRVVDVDKNEDLVPVDIEENETREIIATYDDIKDFVIDGNKYFLIKLDRQNGNILVGLCNKKNNVVIKVIGKKPIDIYQTIINKQKVPIRKDHAAYLGRELQKAYIALKNNLEYIQDQELDLNRKNQ